MVAAWRNTHTHSNTNFTFFNQKNIKQHTRANKHKIDNELMKNKKYTHILTNSFTCKNLCVGFLQSGYVLVCINYMISFLMHAQINTMAQHIIIKFIIIYKNIKRNVPKILSSFDFWWVFTDLHDKWRINYSFPPPSWPCNESLWSKMYFDSCH